MMEAVGLKEFPDVPERLIRRNRHDSPLHQLFDGCGRFGNHIAHYRQDLDVPRSVLAESEGNP